MFKSASLFKITLPQPMLVDTLGDAAARNFFLPCGASQERSVGWVPPRGHEHGAMVENVGGHLIMRLMVETKNVPTQAITDKVAAQVKQIEATTGRKPGKKETRELKEDARMALLPMAFPVRSSTLVWIDPAKGLLVIDSASYARVDEVTMQLVKLMDGIAIHGLNTKQSPASAMTQWLIANDWTRDHEYSQNGFNVGRECAMKSCDESKASVRYTRHSLDSDEVRQHITQGKLPTALALEYNDRVSFVLTDGGQLTKFKFLDLVFEGRSDQAADAFDADVAILTGELSRLIPDLVDALGGEVVAEGGAV